MDLNALPAVFCACLGVGSLVLCMERLYATLNYAKYEYEDFSNFLARFFTFLWSVLLISVIWSFLLELSRGVILHHYLLCVLSQIGRNTLKSQWHLLFSMIFQSAFLLFHWAMLKVNQEKQEIYVKHYYSSLSPRFQIGENIKGLKLVMSLAIILIMALALLLAHSWYWENTEGSESHRLFQQELNLLILPTLSVIMPLHVMCSSAPLKSRSKIIGRQLLVSRIYLAGTSKTGRPECLKSSTAEGCNLEMLREYWDDCTHLE
uniref:Uncharacterized protein n=1 Tax=Ditylenchus dipsaci TaxID=166011 RepID=A0A915DDT0_9BILA